MTSDLGGQAPPAGGYSLFQHIARTLRLAVPAMLARAGMLLLITADSVMTGHAGAAELAHYGLSMAPFIVVMVVGIGLLAGTPILTAQRHGADRPEACGAVWRVGMVMAGVLGLVGGLALLAGEPLFLLFGQSPEMAAGAAAALTMHAWGMPGILLFLATTFFLEGISRPVPGMVIALSVNVLNVALNWLLIEGNWGLPAMGAAGAAFATSVSRWVMFAAIAAYVLMMRDAKDFAVWGGLRGQEETIRKALRLGAPLAVTTGLEVCAFSFVATFAGRMGEVPMAAYQASMNINTLVFMLSIGLAAATAVRVANAIGRNDGPGMRMAAWTGIGMTVGLLLLLGLAIWIWPEALAKLYSDDPAVVSVILAALVVVAVMIIADGAQAVLASAARAAGDVLIHLAIFAVTFWGIGVPLAYWAGLRAGHGVPGLMGAMTLAIGVAALALAFRFQIVARRGVKPL
jgi:MATE family multidrug resistance protein